MDPFARIAATLQAKQVRFMVIGVAGALDAFLGKRSAAPLESPEPLEPTPEQTPPTDTTGSLLAARRRARKKRG